MRRVEGGDKIQAFPPQPVTQQHRCSAGGLGRLLVAERCPSVFSSDQVSSGLKSHIPWAGGARGSLPPAVPGYPDGDSRVWRDGLWEL